MSRRRIHDEEILAALRQVIDDHGVINSQFKLQKLVNQTLGEHFHQADELPAPSPDSDLEPASGPSKPAMVPETGNMEEPEREPFAGITAKRLRRLAINSDFIRLTIHSREEGKIDKMEICPVCGGKMKPIKNKTLYDWEIVLQFNCTKCPYWTPKANRRIPVRYVFSKKQVRTPTGDTSLLSLSIDPPK